jgi:hypothetical protein
VLPVSLDYPFLIAPSVFSNVYLLVLPVSLDCPFLIAPLEKGNPEKLATSVNKR